MNWRVIWMMNRFWKYTGKDYEYCIKRREKTVDFIHWGCLRGSRPISCQVIVNNSQLNLGIYWVLTRRTLFVDNLIYVWYVIDIGQGYYMVIHINLLRLNGDKSTWHTNISFYWIKLMGKILSIAYGNFGFHKHFNQYCDTFQGLNWNEHEWKSDCFWTCIIWILVNV